MVASLNSPRLKMGSEAKEGVVLGAETLQPRVSKCPTDKSCGLPGKFLHSNAVPHLGNFMELKKAWLIQRMLPKSVTSLEEYRETRTFNILLWVQRSSTTNDYFHRATASPNYL